MTKEEALQTLKMLSALESWAFSLKSPLPDYLHDNLTVAMEVLERIILGKHGIISSGQSRHYDDN